MHDEAALQTLNERARPTALARERLVPVHDALTTLLPDGLVRGSSVQVSAGGAGGTTSLALALLAAPSAAGAWVVTVGLPSLGLAAAAGFGVDLGKLVLVAAPGPGEWGTVVATLLEAFEVVVARPPVGAGGRPAAVRAADARRLAARARERGSVLVRLGPPGWWPEGADVSLTVTGATWSWAGDRRRDVAAEARGHLQARRATVEATGRRGAARPRAAELWLPGPAGELAVAEPLAEVRPLVPIDPVDVVAGRPLRPDRRGAATSIRRTWSLDDHLDRNDAAGMARVRR